MLFITFWLGVLVTYAEPAIAAIRPLAGLVDPQSAPYLYYILNQKQEVTVSVGLGTCMCVDLGEGWGGNRQTHTPTNGRAVLQCKQFCTGRHIRPVLLQ